jgi:hypothetical protein
MRKLASRARRREPAERAPRFQRGPGLGLAKEGRDADQQVLAQRADLLGRVAQQGVVVGQALDAGQAHAPAHAAHHHRLLVAAKVASGAQSQQRDDVVQHVVVGSGQRVAAIGAPSSSAWRA